MIMSLATDAMVSGLILVFSVFSFYFFLLYDNLSRTIVSISELHHALLLLFSRSTSDFDALPLNLTGLFRQ